MAETVTSEHSGEARATGFGSSLSYIREHMREYGILFALIAIIAFFQVATGGILLMPVNVTNLILQNSYIVIMALGMLLIIVAGHIDLSVGSVSGFVGAVAAVMMVPWKMDPFVTMLACLALGAAIDVGAITAWRKGRASSVAGRRSDRSRPP